MAKINFKGVPGAVPACVAQSAKSWDYMIKDIGFKGCCVGIVQGTDIKLSRINRSSQNGNTQEESENENGKKMMDK